MSNVELICGDCKDVMSGFADNTFDSIVTDPPYELGFMGKEWDGSGIAYNVKMWEQVLRVLKPGGYLLAFGGDRTEHRLKCAIEDAGFEIRTTVAWVFGSGFPKSYNVSKKLNSVIPSSLRCVCAHHSMNTTSDSRSDCRHVDDLCDEQLLFGQDNGQDAFPLQGGVLGHNHDDLGLDDLLKESKHNHDRLKIDRLSIEDCQLLYGLLLEDSQSSDNILFDILGNMLHDELTAEHKMDFRKSDTLHLEHDSVFSSYSTSLLDSISRTYHKCKVCEKYYATEGIGTALKPAAEFICVARKPFSGTVAGNVLEWGTGGINIDGCRVGSAYDNSGRGIRTKDWHDESQVADKKAGMKTRADPHHQGRWPANFIHDGSDEVVGLFPQSKSTGGDGYKNSMFCGGKKTGGHGLGDSGSAARFFYCAKASKRDRDEGLDGMELKKMQIGDERPSGDSYERRGQPPTFRRNTHPTVKPTDLMRYLCRLVTPPDGVILDPFCGSGSTGKGAVLEGFNFTGIDEKPEYIEIARPRIEFVQKQQRRLF